MEGPDGDVDEKYHGVKVCVDNQSSTGEIDWV